MVSQTNKLAFPGSVVFPVLFKNTKFLKQVPCTWTVGWSCSFTHCWSLLPSGSWLQGKSILSDLYLLFQVACGGSWLSFLWAPDLRRSLPRPSLMYHSVSIHPRSQVLVWVSNNDKGVGSFVHQDFPLTVHVVVVGGGCYSPPPPPVSIFLIRFYFHIKNHVGLYRPDCPKWLPNDHSPIAYLVQKLSAQKACSPPSFTQKLQV